MMIRKAKEIDLPLIVAMLADDKLGSIREDYQLPLPSSYIEAFHKIDRDSNQKLIVVENEQGEIIGAMQLSFIQYLTYQGGIRAQMEAVRIHKNYRGTGLGTKMLKWAIFTAKENGAHVIQLTTDKKRPDAIRFYESLGFKTTHEGMKMHL
ncbi:GNAT family N-acetyltransferase [Fulvivirga sedimenti]|uniref:GNAT family N-acetyltransferase n=1 Tax=Fulvivirga sedimenti TaxID=2879465 RepID=A0A9X1KVN5_9BACT|nr:GNAT family N-acetyltransferase [Fulvivirga sedimenti]MCA6075003.1 GNAT family N-acetyltransferase [Fulvivirga sedimenti]MCA6076180.1 GNAT family N-acetyltransferase [Fulvivirga sedimenti]MCA6077308.1 GNAT family N-acetyltransferase [Fulvivirga sedimenti]